MLVRELILEVWEPVTYARDRWRVWLSSNKYKFFLNTLKHNNGMRDSPHWADSGTQSHIYNICEALSKVASVL